MIDLLLGRKLEPPSFMTADGQAVLLRLDACTSQIHQYKNEISKYPVEEGLDPTDHIRQDPETIVIEGVVSNSPVAGILFQNDRYVKPVSDYNTIVGDKKDRVMTAYEILLLISGRRMVRIPDKTGGFIQQTIRGSKPMMFDLSAGLRVFTDMVMEDLTFDFDKMTGDSLLFKAKCSQVRKISTKESTINYANGKLYGAAGVEDQTTVDDKGQQQAAEPTVKHKSVIKAFSEKSGSMGEKLSAGFSHLLDF